MSRQSELVEGTNKYLISNYGRLPVAMVRGKGSRIWDADGGEYLDFFAGFGAGGVTGHSHPAVIDAVCKQAQQLLFAGNLFTNEPQVELARRITAGGFGGKAFFCNSGGEANEAAMKLVRYAAKQAGGEKKHKIISFNNCFHGRTMGALSLTPEKFQKGFEPMVPGNSKADLNDLDSVKKLVDDQTAGVFVEPIQGEGGMNVPTRAFMQGLRKLCDEKGLLLVCDEVWTSPARTGKLYGHQLYDITPDVMTLGKACGGGLPVAAMIAAPKYQDVLVPGKHGCTLGGNLICMAAGVAVFKLVEEEKLAQRCAKLGEAAMKTIRSAKASCVKDVRGSGMMIGIELDKPGKGVFQDCMAGGLLINVTQDTVLRLAPPAIISEADLNKGLEILIAALKK